MPTLFRWLTDGALADSIAGDLAEQRRRRAERSPFAATLWYWWRSVALTIFFIGTATQARLGRTLRRSAAGAAGWGADVRYALRSLRRSPWYAATVVGVIALGMTLATTVFAVVDGVLFKPLPYPDADRLVAIEAGFNHLPPATTPPVSLAKLSPGTGVSLLDIAAWQAAAPEAAITAFRIGRLGMSEGASEVLLGVALVQPNFFDTIGIHPIVGGLVASDFDHQDVVLPVVITYEAWQSRFSGVGDVIGRKYIDDPTTGGGFRVVGILPRGFVFPSSRTTVSFIAPYVVSPADRDPSRRLFYGLVARIPPGMTTAALRGRIEAGMAAMAATLPVKPKPPGFSDRGWRMEGPFDHADVFPLAFRLGSSDRPLFRAIFLAALVLLVLGGLNVSGLMAARGLDRSRELGLRRALGATGLRLARLVFLEALLPIVVAAAIGLFLAVPLLRLGVRLLPEDLVLLKAHVEPAVDARVVMFVVLSAIVLAGLTTIWPIRRALSIGAAPLADGSRGSTGTRSLGRTAVIVSQTAGALVLTMGGALLVTSIMAVYANTPAIRTKGIVALREWMQNPAVPTTGAPDLMTRTRTLLDTLRRLPGIDGVALTEGQVLEGGGGVPWWHSPPEYRGPRIDIVAQAVTPDFYRVLEPQLVIGRFPTTAETEGSGTVIVVSESVARTYWPNASPLGQSLTYQRQNHSDPYTVVGVVKDVRWNYWDTAVAAVYGPYARLSGSSNVTVFLRTRNSAAQITAAATQAIANVDPLIRTTHAATLDELFVDTVRPRRFQAWLFGSFAAAALVIVGSGIFGLIAMSTARRTREMGIRLALGSTREGLMRLLLREQLMNVAAGVIAGSLFSAWAVRFVKSYLYEITPYDPRVWAAAIIVIVATAAIGTLIPAWRASKTDPVNALRAE